MIEEAHEIDRDHDEPATATLHLGTAEWHDGTGWYYIDDEYPEEGSCGAFATKEEAREHAEKSGYVLHDPITNEGTP